MEQSKLEKKVEELFSQQGFDLEKDGNRYRAENKGTELEISVFSSEKFSMEDVKENYREGEKVFVDEGLRDAKEEISAEVSVLKEDSNEDEVRVPSYERIGDIVVISELDEMSTEQAVEGVLEHNPGIDSILLKTQKLSGEFRVGDYELLYGDKTETVHKEHDTKIKVDPTEMFFSEREGTERKRIFESVERGEEVLVMFCGAGPFPVTIARNSKPSRVIGVEKNPEAVKYAKENVELNNVSDTVEILEGDVKEVCPDLGSFDRVLMPSPTNSLEFVTEAIGCTAEGGVLVVYSIQDKENLYGEVVSKVENEAEKQGREVEVLEKRVVADFSPAKRKVAVEFKLNGQNHQ